MVRAMFQRHFALLLSVASVAVVLFALFILASTMTFGPDGSPLVPVLLFLGLIGVALLVPRLRRRNASLPETAEGSLAVLERQLGSPLIPYRQTLLAINGAMVLASYGREREARDKLALASADGLPPSIEAARFEARAVLAYLSDDGVRGLSDARRAERLLADQAPYFGRARERRLASFYVAWGQALAGEPVTHADVALGLRSDPNPLMRALACAASLHIEAARGDQQASEVARQELARLAPHARGLLLHAGVLARSVSSEAVAAQACVRCGALVGDDEARVGPSQRRFCSACAMRLGEQARGRAPLMAEVRGLAFLWWSMTALWVLSALAGLYTSAGEGDLVTTLPALGVLGFLVWRSIKVARTLRTGRLPERPMYGMWLLSFVVLPVGTLLGAYALFRLRPSIAAALRSDDQRDGIVFAGLAPRTSWPIAVLGLLAIPLSVLFVVLLVG